MAGPVSGAEIGICAGAFTSIFLLKYLLSRSGTTSSSSNKDPKIDYNREFGESGVGISSTRLNISDGPSSSTSTDDRHSAGFMPVIGLENLGNTCYLNSLLQALVCIPEFISWLQQAKLTVCSPRFHSSKKRDGLGVPNFGRAVVSRSENITRNFFHSFCRAVEALNPKRLSVQRSYVASSLANVIFDGAGQVGRNYQQDPDELFLFVNNLLSNTLAHGRSSFDIEQLKEISIEELEKSKDHIACRPLIYAEPCNSLNRVQFTGLPFHGLLYEELYCVVCRKSRPLPLELFASLSLTFPHGRKTFKACFLEDLLGNYFTPADLDSVECPTCTNQTSGRRKVNTPHLKRTALARLPKILCIHIRRAVWDGIDASKRPDIVNFGASLFTSDFLWFKYLSETSVQASPTPRTNTTKNVSGGTYSLYSVIVHVGSLTSRGHVVAYRKGPVSSKNANYWYYTSDDVVRRVDWSEVENANPYMLFYQQVDSSS